MKEVFFLNTTIKKKTVLLGMCRGLMVLFFIGLVEGRGEGVVFQKKVGDSASKNVVEVKDANEKELLEAADKNPKDVFSNGNYALFLEYTKKDYEQAEKYYLKAISLPISDETTGQFLLYFLKAYILFLENVKKDFTQIEKYYLKALRLDPNDITTTEDYIDFLVKHKKDFTTAESYYLRVLDKKPHDIQLNVDFAKFLFLLKRDNYMAEKYFLKSLDIDSNHLEANLYYGVFLRERKNFMNAEKCFLKTLKLTKNNAKMLAHTAQFYFLMNKSEQGKKFLEWANQQNENAVDVNESAQLEILFYEYAYLYNNFKHNEQKIEALINGGIKNNWDIEKTLEQVLKTGHPQGEKLKFFALHLK